MAQYSKFNQFGASPAPTTGFSKLMNDTLNTLIPRIFNHQEQLKTLNSTVNDATKGNDALKTLIDANTTSVGTLNTTVSTVSNIVNDANKGNDALKTLIDANTTSVGTLNTTVTNVSNIVNDANKGNDALKARLDTIDPSNITQINANVANITKNADKIVKNNELWNLYESAHVLYPTINVDATRLDAEGETVNVTANPLPFNRRTNQLPQSELDTMVVSGEQPKIEGVGGWTYRGNGGCEWKIWDANMVLKTYEDTAQNLMPSPKAKDLEFIYITLNESIPYNNALVKKPKIKIKVKDTNNDTTSDIFFTYQVKDDNYPLQFEVDDAVTYVACPLLESSVFSAVQGAVQQLPGQESFELPENLNELYSSVNGSTSHSIDVSLFQKTGYRQSNSDEVQNTAGDLMKNTYHSGMKLGGSADEVLRQVANVGVSIGDGSDFFPKFGLNNSTHMLPITRLINGHSWRLYPYVNLQKTQLYDKLVNAPDNLVIDSISVVADAGSGDFAHYENATFTLSSCGVKFKNTTTTTLQFSDHLFSDPVLDLKYNVPLQIKRYLESDDYKVDDVVVYPHANSVKRVQNMNNVELPSGFNDIVINYQNNGGDGITFEFKDCMINYPDNTSNVTVAEFKLNYGSHIDIEGTAVSLRAPVKIKYHSHATLAAKQAEPQDIVNIYFTYNYVGGNLNPTVGFIYDFDSPNYDSLNQTKEVIFKWGVKYKINSIIDGTHVDYAGSKPNGTLTSSYTSLDSVFPNVLLNVSLFSILSRKDVNNDSTDRSKRYYATGDTLPWRPDQPVEADERLPKPAQPFDTISRYIFYGADKPVPFAYDVHYPVYIIPPYRFSEYLISENKGSLHTNSLTTLTGNWEIFQNLEITLNYEQGFYLLSDTSLTNGTHIFYDSSDLNTTILKTDNQIPSDANSNGVSSLNDEGNPDDGQFAFEFRNAMNSQFYLFKDFNQARRPLLLPKQVLNSSAPFYSTNPNHWYKYEMYTEDEYILRGDYGNQIILPATPATEHLYTNN